MWTLIFSLPILISAPFFLLYHEVWWYVAIPLAIVEGILILVWHFSTTSVEFLGAYPVKITHICAWTEEVERIKTRYIDGELVEEKEYDERYHPDKYTWVLNTGKKQTIDASVFDALADEWGDIEYIDTHYSNCIDGGGIEVAEWNGYEEDTWTVTYTHRYRNPFKHSNSLFKVRKHYSEYEAEKNGLFKYPEITDYYQDAIVFRDGDIVSKYHSVEAEDEFQKINAFEGYEREIHVFVLLYNSDKYNKDVSFKQRDYWNGLNKNELVICIGADEKKAQWCNVLSWSDSVEWLRSVEKKVLSMDELDLYEFSKWLRMNLDGWVRKEFKDFSYLKR